MEVTLKNLKYHRSRWKLLQLIFSLFLIYLIILWLFKSLNYSIHLMFGLFIILSFYSLLNIVDKEVVKVLKDFGLQYSTHFLLSRTKTNFIPMSNIHRIVINEVIYLVCKRCIIFIELISYYFVESGNFCASNSHRKRIPSTNAHSRTF